MQNIGEIRKAGKSAFVKSVLEIGEKAEDKPFNSDIGFSEQIAGFDSFQTAESDISLMIEDAKKFR